MFWALFSCKIRNYLISWSFSYPCLKSVTYFCCHLICKKYQNCWPLKSLLVEFFFKFCYFLFLNLCIDKLLISGKCCFFYSFNQSMDVRPRSKYYFKKWCLKKFHRFSVFKHGTFLIGPVSNEFLMCCLKSINKTI